MSDNQKQTPQIIGKREAPGSFSHKANIGTPADHEYDEPQGFDDEFLFPPSGGSQPVRSKATSSQKKLKTLVGKPSPYCFKLFDVDEVREKMASLPGHRDSVVRKGMLGKMLNQKGMVELRPVPRNYEVILNRLELEYPHFKEVIEYLRQMLRMQRIKKYPALDFGANILLDGPAGVGKSSFLTRLSDSLGTRFATVSCAAATNSFDLTGLSSGWGTGKHGKLHELLVTHACPNPVILLDEIEKAVEREKFGFIGALYGLLEKNNARSFRDEFIDIGVDASRINWFATSNHADRLDSAIRDRFEVLTVRLPNETELQSIVPKLYKGVLVERDLGGVFSPRLSKKVTEQVIAIESGSIRRVKSVLERAISNACLRAGYGCKISLQTADIPARKQNTDVSGNPMGFIWRTP
ncbi:AAA family ATPase [Mariprofundus ferrooxydans]|uniref:AAA family ATPase n=1 Tax=Mariprofundus ferrooxydans TaxID=314344 RepID=UPI00142F3FA5|nr:AAA family ATPase [Mariprofundus ferrooxydans]